MAAVLGGKNKAKALTGNDAVAYGMKQINPDVVAAYPITPQTSMMEKFSQFVSDGEVDTEMILTESEHSALSATIGSQAAGARTMTATSSNGLAFMWEILYIAAGLRLPIVMPVVNRALSGPINIHCDHSDTMGARDAGWIQLFAENAQEAYENVIQAVRIAEHLDVSLPCMSMHDGFIISHGVENVTIYDDVAVRKFIGEYKPQVTLLDAANPVTVGAFDIQDSYFEHRRQIAEAMRNSYHVILEVGKEFGRVFGKEYGLIEKYKLDDAEVAIIAIGSTCGTAKVVVDGLRNSGKKAGLLKIRAFRPFPRDEIVAALKNVKAVAVLDRSDALNGLSGQLYMEITSGLYSRNVRMPAVDYIYGLGGRDMGLADIERVYNELFNIAKTGSIKQELTYVGVRE